MKPVLTSYITQRAKVGFDIPAHEWFRGTLRNLLLETLDFAEAEYSDLFRFDTIRNLTKLHLNRSISIGYHLWGLMTVFLWMKRWKISSATIPQSKTQMSTIGS
jgi:asparagine synthase (glutamine-hydrolysing)